MPKYEAVFFDAGDTLIDFYSTGERVTAIVEACTGQAIPAEQAAPYFEAAFQHALGGRPDGLLWVNDTATERQYWGHYYEGWLRAAGVPPTDALIAELVDDTIQVEIYAPFPEATATLAALQDHGIRLVLISNAFPSMQRIMQHLDLERYFTQCLYSCSVGFEKPQAEMFHLALRAGAVPAGRACFVDDVPGHVEAAMSLGIRGYLIDRWARHRHSPLPRLTSLRELLGELDVSPLIY